MRTCRPLGHCKTSAFALSLATWSRGQWKWCYLRLKQAGMRTEGEENLDDCRARRGSVVLSLQSWTGVPGETDSLLLQSQPSSSGPERRGLWSNRPSKTEDWVSRALFSTFTFRMLPLTKKECQWKKMGLRVLFSCLFLRIASRLGSLISGSGGLAEH